MKMEGHSDYEYVPPPGQVVIQQPKPPKPKASCNKCYGRGFIGKNTKTGQMVMCQCIQKKMAKYVEEFRKWKRWADEQTKLEKAKEVAKNGEDVGHPESRTDGEGTGEDRKEVDGVV